MGRMKGTGWQPTYDFFLRIGGAEGMAKVMAALDEKDRRELSRPILASSWVDYGSFIRFLVMCDRLLGKGDFAFMEEANRQTTLQQFRGIYRVFIRMGVKLISPKFSHVVYSVVWKQMFDEGDVSVTWLGPTHLRATITNFTDMPLHHEHDLLPTTATILELIGIRKLEMSHTHCKARGDDACVLELRWS